MSWFIKYSKYTQERDTTLTRFKVAQDKGMIKQGLKGHWTMVSDFSGKNNRKGFLYEDFCYETT